MWPLKGRCTACGHAAEMYPSRRWYHLNGPCPMRSTWLKPAGGFRTTTAKFVADDLEACIARHPAGRRLEQP